MVFSEASARFRDHAVILLRHKQCVTMRRVGTKACDAIGLGGFISGNRLFGRPRQPASRAALKLYGVGHSGGGAAGATHRDEHALLLILEKVAVIDHGTNLLGE